MNDEALLREKAATLTRMLNFQGTTGMFGHVSVRVPGTDKCFISPGASTDKTPAHLESPTRKSGRCSCMARSSAPACRPGTFRAWS
jgi:hypothetical protein